MIQQKRLMDLFAGLVSIDNPSLHEAEMCARLKEELCALGAEPESICAAMGASIGRCCFETDDDVPDAVKKYLGCDAEEFFDRRPDGKTMVDLRAANAMRLRQLGLRAENIDVSHECTMCSHEKYWSHRYTQRMGQGRGSLAAGIVLD